VEEDDNDNEDEEEDDTEDDNNGNEPRMIDQGEMVNTSAENVDILVDNQPMVLPEQD